ncbi:cytidylyltransferase domain-containing protein [Pendulispora albinea]|uniref:Glycosyltransferase family protein n=1 Tax=Pendulispora albinea TaxID=2741071 RepID=A0ABZ2M7W9_9BACT
MRTLVVVQARVSSTRLPGKVLRPLAGRPMLIRQLERIDSAQAVFDLVVATTTDPADDPIVETTRRAGFDVFRGHPTDLLDRHYRLAREKNADVVVKIPSDCPLIDPAAIDRVIGTFLHASGVDYASNLHPPSWPDGNDVEVMTMDALAIAHERAVRDFEREHTTPFLWDHPERFMLLNVAWETGMDYSRSHRFTVDYEEDYAFVARVYDELQTSQAPFTLDAILALLEQKPELLQIHERYAGVNWYRHHLGELRTKTLADTRAVEPREDEHARIA